MLAFNLGIFFRNLKGEEVEFSGKNEHCEVNFIGGVQALEEQTDVTSRLEVVLAKNGLACHIAFDEEEDEEESPEETVVDVRLTRQIDGEEQVLTRTTFRFKEISLKPLVPESSGDAAQPPLN